MTTVSSSSRSFASACCGVAGARRGARSRAAIGIITIRINSTRTNTVLRIASTIDVILEEYPDIDSIRDIGFFLSSAWNQDFASLFGEPVTLDEIEHEIIRGWGRYNEPRIHFAVNCAAIGCPALRAEAFISEKLEMQLEDSTVKFLSDRSRNYFDNGRMYVSSIFDWYKEDFEKGWGGVDSVAEFLARYAAELELDSAIENQLRADDIRIRHLKYDWGLNDTQ